MAYRPVLKKIVISLALGLAGFAGSYLALNVSVPPLHLSIVWSYLFPLTAAMAYGGRYGVLAGTVGLGALFPFFLWPNNGWANAVSSAMILFWYGWQGFCSSARRRKKAVWNHPYAAQVPYAVLNYLATVLLHPAAYTLNPPFWAPNAPPAIPDAVLHSMAIKAVINLFLIVIIARALLRIPSVRRFLGLPVKATSRYNGRIIALAVSGTALLWAVYNTLNSVLVLKNFPRVNLWISDPQEVTALLVLIASAFLSGSVICSLMEYRLQAQDNLLEANRMLEAANQNLEERVRERAMRLDATLNALPDMLFELDADGIFVDYRAPSPELLLVPPPEFLGKNYRDVIPEPARTALSRAMDSATSAGLVTGCVYRLDLSGGARWFEMSVSVKGNPRDPNRRFIALVRDITSRIEAEEELKKRESLLDSLLKSIPIPVFFKDVNGLYINVNPAFEKINGKSREELIGKGVLDLFPHELAKVYHEKDLELFRNPGTQVYDWKVRDADGEIRDVIFHKAAFYDGDGQVAGLVGAIFDITDRKKMETALRESEEKYRLLIRNSPDLICLQDPDGRVAFLSDHAEKVLGHPRDTVLAQKLPDFIHPEDLANVRDAYERAFRDRSAVNIDYRITDSGGGVRWISHSARPVMLDGQFTGVLSTLRDITDRVRSEEQLHEKDRLMVLQSRQAAMGEMLGNIAHQWRQPLNAIGIMVQNIGEYSRESRLTPDYVDQTVADVMKLVLHMSRTIDDFRNFFRTDKEKKDIPLHEAVQKALSFVSASFHDNGVETRTEFGEDLAVSGYPNEFSQAVLNILNNALEAFLERRTPDPVLTVRVFAERGRPVITVSDNAGGIPEEALPKIFEPYFTTKEKGTGIGLFMAKMILEKNMGASIIARNIPGGAEFRIEF